MPHRHTDKDADDALHTLSDQQPSRSSWVHCQWISIDRRGRRANGIFLVGSDKAGKACGRKAGTPPRRFHYLYSYRNSSSASTIDTSCRLSLGPFPSRTCRQRWPICFSTATYWHQVLCAHHPDASPSLHMSLSQVRVWSPPELALTTLLPVLSTVPIWLDFEARHVLPTPPQSASWDPAQATRCLEALPSAPVGCCIQFMMSWKMQVRPPITSI